jgi:hypothetical protein
MQAKSPARCQQAIPVQFPNIKRQFAAGRVSATLSIPATESAHDGFQDLPKSFGNLNILQTVESPESLAVSCLAGVFDGFPFSMVSVNSAVMAVCIASFKSSFSCRLG